MAGSPHHHIAHRHKRFVFTIAIGAGIYNAVEISKLSNEVNTIRTADTMAIDQNIESLIASQDLSTIVKAAVNIANRKVKDDTKLT